MSGQRGHVTVRFGGQGRCPGRGASGRISSRRSREGRTPFRIPLRKMVWGSATARGWEWLHRPPTMGSRGALGGGLLEQLASTAGLSVSKASRAGAAAAAAPRHAHRTAGADRHPGGASSWLGGWGGPWDDRVEPARAGSPPPAASPSDLEVAAPGRRGGGPAPARRPPPPHPSPGSAAGGNHPPPVTHPTAPPPVTAARIQPWPVKIYFATDSKTIGTDDRLRIQRAADYPTAESRGLGGRSRGSWTRRRSRPPTEELAKERAKAFRGGCRGRDPRGHGRSCAAGRPSPAVRHARGAARADPLEEREAPKKSLGRPSSA